MGGLDWSYDELVWLCLALKQDHRLILMGKECGNQSLIHIGAPVT